MKEVLEIIIRLNTINGWLAYDQYVGTTLKLNVT